MRTADIRKNRRADYAVRYLSGGAGNLGDPPPTVRVARVESLDAGTATVRWLDFGTTSKVPTRDILGTWAEHCNIVNARDNNAFQTPEDRVRP